MSTDEYDSDSIGSQSVKHEAEQLFAQGLIYHEGIIQPKDNLEALQCFTLSACRGYVSALRMLIGYHHDGVVNEPDLREAYIWAVILKTLDPASSDEKLLTALESTLNRRDKISAQKEAKQRYAQLKQNGMIALHEPEPSQEIPLEQVPKSESQTTTPNPLIDMKGKDIGDIKLKLFIKSGNLSILYRSQKVKTLKAAEMFSDHCLRLLILFDKQATYGELPVGYYDATISDSRKGSKRSNRQIVADFNYTLRKQLGLPKDIKPFEWLGDRFHRDLKANFTLEVVY